MNYEKVYDNLISRARARVHLAEFEVHHVIPRCMGGTDDKENLVKLTPAEHYVAHQLLSKMHPTNQKLALASFMMTVGGTRNNKLYAWVRRRHREAMSESQSGEKNSQFGKMWITNDETLEHKKINNYDPIPIGWSIGRKNKSFYTADPIQSRKYIKKLPVRQCTFCNKDFAPLGREIFCSDKCKTYFRSPAIYTIDQNLQTIFELFADYNSITLVLNKFGISGRQGNTYLSKILKQHGFTILRRRNT